MNKRALCAGVFASFVVLGCAAPGGVSRTGISSDCSGASCQIDVLAECVAGACAATVDKKILGVLDRGAIAIHWNLRAGSEFRFADAGVTFPGGAPFNCTPPQSNKVTCVDRNQTPGTYAYRLDVVRAGNPSTTIPVDPWIVNK